MESVSPADTTEIERYRPPGELARKRAASVARVWPSKRVTNGRVEIMSGEDKWAVVGAMNKAAARGEVHVLRRYPQWNPNTGRWEVVVRRLKDPAPWWIKPILIIGTTLSVLSALTLLGAWVMTTLGSIGASVVAMAIAALAIIYLIRGLTRPRGGRGAVEVDVRVRVR